MKPLVRVTGRRAALVLRHGGKRNDAEVAVEDETGTLLGVLTLRAEPREWDVATRSYVGPREYVAFFALGADVESVVGRDVGRLITFRVGAENSRSDPA